MLSNSHSSRTEAGTRHVRVVGRNVLLKNLTETSRAFQMGFFVVVARRFGPAVLGDITFLLMLGSVAGLLFGDLGVNTTLIARMNATDGLPRERLAAIALFCKVALTLLSLALMIIAMRIARPSGSWLEILSITAISCGSIWHEFLASLTNGVNRLDVEPILRLAYRGAVYGGGALMCLSTRIEPVLIYMAIAAAATLTAGFIVIHVKIISLHFFFHTGMAVSLLRHSAPLWITQIAQLTFLKLDVVILGLLHVGSRELGWYSAAWKIVDVLTTVPALLAAAVLPLISGALPKTDIRTICPSYLKAMYVLSFLFAIPISIGAPWIVRVLYGNSYSGAAAVLGILVWAVVPICVHSFLVTVSVAARRQKEAARFAAIAAVLGLAAAVALVPRVGYEAMAVISLAVNSLFAMALVYRFRDITRSAHLSMIAKSLAGALFAYALSCFLSSGFPAPLAMLVGVAAYGGALLVLGAIRWSELDRGREIVNFMLGRS